MIIVWHNYGWRHWNTIVDLEPAKTAAVFRGFPGVPETSSENFTCGFKAGKPGYHSSNSRTNTQNFWEKRQGSISYSLIASH